METANKNTWANNNSRSLKDSFIKGFSETLVLGKKPEIRRFNDYSEVLNHDVGFFKEDLIETLTEAAKVLPKEKKVKLKNEILKLETTEDFDGFALKLSENGQCK